MNKNIISEINRAKVLMGLIVEDLSKTINDEQSYIKYLEENGFQRMNPLDAQDAKTVSDKFLPSKFSINESTWFYLNKETNSYSMKWKKNGDITLGTFGNYLPKEGKRDPRRWTTISEFPAQLSNIDEFIKPDLDLEWDAQSLSHRLDTAKNSYHNFLTLNDKGELIQKDTNRVFDKKFVESYKRGIKHVIDEVESLLPKLSKKELIKPVTSKQFGVNYSKISDYIAEIKKEATKLGLFDEQLVFKK